MNSKALHKLVLRTTGRNQQLAALREGRKTRSTFFRPKKGKGSYIRKPKHDKHMTYRGEPSE